MSFGCSLFMKTLSCDLSVAVGMQAMLGMSISYLRRLKHMMELGITSVTFQLASNWLHPLSPNEEVIDLSLPFSRLSLMTLAERKEKTQQISRTSHCFVQILRLFPFWVTQLIYHHIQSLWIWTIQDEMLQKPGEIFNVLFLTYMHFGYVREMW